MDLPKDLSKELAAQLRPGGLMAKVLERLETEADEMALQLQTYNLSDETELARAKSHQAAVKGFRMAIDRIKELAEDVDGKPDAGAGSDTDA